MATTTLKVSFYPVEGESTLKEVEWDRKGSPVDFLFDEAKEFIGGFVECQPWLMGREMVGYRLFDEDGLAKQLPSNPHFRFDGLVGPVVTIERADGNPL